MNRNIHFYEPNDAYGFLSNFFSAPININGTIWKTRNITIKHKNSQIKQHRDNSKLRYT